MRMQRNKKGISKEEDDFGILCSGRIYKIFKTKAEKRDSHSEFERR
jgi:hypothetical protein